MSTHQLGTFLLLEGTIVTALLLARIVCLRILPADGRPVLLERRIQSTERVAPALLRLAAVAVVAGAALRLVS